VEAVAAAGHRAGKGPALAADAAHDDRWGRAANDIELVRRQLDAARLGPLADLTAAARAVDAERMARAESALGWTLAAARTRLGDAEDEAAGAVDLLAEIRRLRDEERAIDGEGKEARARIDAMVQRVQRQDFFFDEEDDDAHPGVPANAAAGSGATANEWVHHHGRTLEEAVANQLVALPVATGHARLRWSAGEARFLARVLGGLRELNGSDLWAGVRRAVVPADLDAIVDDARVLERTDAADGRARGPLAWYPEVAIAIARVLAGRVVDSLARLAPRYVAVADARVHAHPQWPAGTNAPETPDLVPAHPIDPAVIAALCRGSVEVGPGPAVTGPHDPPVELEAANRLRRIQRHEWQSTRDAWAWVRVHEPADATVEEVAATFLGRPDAAYRVSASPPLFGFLPEDAARIPGARAALPVHGDAHGADGFLFFMRPVESMVGGTVTAHPLDALAQSELCDQAALAQAEAARARRTGKPDDPREATSRKRADENLAAVALSLGLFARDLTRFGLSWRLREVRERTTARRQELAEAPDVEVTRWCALAEEQASFLEEIALEIDRVVRMADAMGAGHGTPGLVALAAELADTLAVSDLVDGARTRLAEFRVHRRVAVAEIMDAELDVAMQELEAVRVEATLHGPDERWVGRKVLVDDLRARDSALRSEVARMRIELAQDRADPKDMERLLERVLASRREAELVAAISRLNPVLAEIDGEEGAMAIFSLCEEELEEARQDLLALKSSFQFLYREWNRRQAALAVRIDHMTSEEAAAEARSALAELDTGLRHLGTERLRTAIQHALERVEHARDRKALVQFALMFGMQVVSVGAGAVFKGVAAAAHAGEVGIAVAQTAGYTASMVTLRAEVLDEPVVDALVSELCGLGGMAAASRAVGATGVNEMISAGRASGRLGRLAARGLDVAAHAGGAAGGQLVGAEAENVLLRGEPLSPDQAQQVFRNGAVFGAAHGVGRQFLDGYLDRMSRLGARGQDLVTRGMYVRRVAAEVERVRDPEAAVALARWYLELSEAELMRLDEIGRDPDALRALGTRTHATLLAQSLADSSAMREQAARGLHGNATGLRPERTPHVLDEARRAGVPVTAKPGHDGFWRHWVGDEPHRVELLHDEQRGEVPLDLRSDGADQAKAHMAHLERVSPLPAMSREQFLDPRPGADELATVSQQGSTEDARGLRDFGAHAVETVTRSERESIIAAGEERDPRYVARIMTLPDYLRYGRFGRQDRPVVFAAEPIDLRGLSRAAQVSKIGYPIEWARRLVGKDLVLVIVDARAEARPLDVEGFEWNDLARVLPSCPELIDEAQDAGIPVSQFPRLLAVWRSTPIGSWPKTSDLSEAILVAKLAHLMDRRLSVSPLFTGINMTRQENGRLGVREVSVSPARRAELGPDNHRVFALGRYTLEDFESSYGTVHVRPEGE